MITAWRSPVRPRGGSPSGRGPGRARRLLGIGLVAALLGLAGVSCDRLPTDRPSTDADGALTSESDWGLTLAQTVSLDPAGGPVLTEIHEWASGPDGRLAAVDRSDGRVHVFSSDGRLEFVLGADGDLGEPMDAAFTPDGRIVVATLRRPHVHVFEANGTPSHSFDLPDVLFALKVASLGDGRLVVLNHRRDPDRKSVV